MAQLDLDEAEREALRKALESYLGELRSEIAHTDAHEVRDTLKNEERILRDVLGRLTDATKRSR